MDARYFIDTGIFTASFEKRQPERMRMARKIIGAALTNSAGVISPQVIQDFLGLALHKFAAPIEENDANAFLETVLLPICENHAPAEIQKAALSLQGQLQYPFEHCLIIASAIKSNCKVLFSDRFRHGEAIASLLVVDPFKSDQSEVEKKVSEAENRTESE